MSLNLNGKVALVTGGSKGIGAATCRALAKAGASVIINYSSDSSAADSLVKEIGSKKALAVKADASSVKGAEEMIKATMNRFGKLDILIANAGGFIESTRINHMLMTSRCPTYENDRGHHRGRFRLNVRA
jgi:3-oxoacyl-[acyl-carrier protein] reductase